MSEARSRKETYVEDTFGEDFSQSMADFRGFRNDFSINQSIKWYEMILRNLRILRDICGILAPSCHVKES